MLRRLMTVILTALSICSQAAVAASSDDGQILRVGGNYVVKSIESDDDQTFRVVFEAEERTGRFDVLRLESDHVHVGVKVGQKVRLSAEILGRAGPTAEVAQVVIFFPSPEGRVPVWLLSTKATNRDIRAGKYLEMHVPANDFMVM